MTQRGMGNGTARAWAEFALKRIVQGIFVLWAAFTAVFIILYLLPNDPIRLMLSGSGSEFGSADEATIEKLRAQHGMDKNVVLQYLDALWGAVRGDFGTSIQTGREVRDMVVDAAGQTAVLGLCALILGFTVGAVVAVASALVKNNAVQQLLLSLPAAGVSLPSFWVGLLLIQYFSFQLGWFPPLGGEGLNGLVLPAVTLAIPTAAFVAQILARSLATTLSEPYVEVIRAKGAGKTHILVVNALRNASLPLLTMIGMIVGNTIAGSVVVETVFSRMGLGRITYEAVDAQDIPVVLAVVTFAALIFVIIGIIVDLINPLLDPRIGSAVVVKRRTSTPNQAASETAVPIDVKAATAHEKEVLL